MRSVYMFMLFILFTVLEMLLFHVNVFSQLTETEVVRAQPQPFIPPSESSFFDQDFPQNPTKRESLDIERLKDLSPLSRPQPRKSQQNNQQNNNNNQPHNNYNQPQTNNRPPPPPSHGKVPSKRQTLAEIRAAKERKRYAEALERGIAKTVNMSRTWYSDPEKYKCYLESNFVCERLNITNVSSLPEPFRDGCAPSFMIVGTAKSGTTSLYFYLFEHPQVHRALSGQFDKEVRYFTDHWGKGHHWYLQQFPPITYNDFPLDGQIHMINGEASPTYFYDVNAPARLKQTTPNAKLIVVLRDPVDRTYSDKMQLIANKVQFKADVYEDMKYEIEVFKPCFQKGKQTKSAMQAFFDCYAEPKLAHRVIRSHPYVMDSIYVYQVQNWLKYFPKEQILFIKGEDMYTDTIGVMDRVTDFLGLCKFDWAPYTQQIHNKRAKAYPKMPDKVRGLLTDFYHDFTEELYTELGYDFGWHSMSP